MMLQYRELKQRYPDYILLFRLGDFYEMFFEDAHLGASLLQIALTSRQKGEGAIPMAGIPHHAAETYVARLIRAGQKVAVCEQMEVPARGQKLVRREIVRLITPGTVTDTQFLDGASNNFLLVVAVARAAVGVALVDVSTGEFLVGEGADAVQAERLLDVALLRRPAEILVPSALDPVHLVRFQRLDIPLTRADPSWFVLRTARDALCAHFRVAGLDAFGLDRMTAGIQAAGAALTYLRDTQGDRLGHLGRIQRLDPGDSMVLDETAVATLELFETVQDRSRRGSLVGAIDATRTPMGARLIRHWLLRPCLDGAIIAARQDAVGTLVDAPALRSAVQERLGTIGDIERLASRAALGVAHARDLTALREFLRQIPLVHDALGGVSGELLESLRAALTAPGELGRLLDEALEDDPPRELKEGGLIREGWNAELGQLREAAREGRSWIASLEARERARTGIATLRVRFNRVFGYAIEVSNSHAAKVPTEYIRRQTLAGAERYVTPELKDYESRIVGAEERAARLEYELFEQVRAAVGAEAPTLLAAAHAIACLDVVAGLARVAHERGYARPVVDDRLALEIVEGRHPVLELDPVRPFTPNDLSLDPAETQIVILTGPNMSGKSVFMRQAALLVIMAQIGSFIPARRARVGFVDRILTRVGAQDNVARGRSTFLVEMVETASILHNATGRSLILLDEVGRGTSTFDGLAIAWAVTEELHERGRGAKVLFATHYHELTALAERLPRVRNFHVAVREWNDEIVFLHTVRPGGTDRSYGIQVARLAGLPPAVIARAREILVELESERVDLSRALAAAPERSGQLALFPPAGDPILKDLAALDIPNLTPLCALNLLAEWQAQLRERT
jgi:DNA mismatch repair protein MutS